MQTLELENYGVVEMETTEKKETDGGYSLIDDLVFVATHHPIVYQAKFLFAVVSAGAVG